MRWALEKTLLSMMTTSHFNLQKKENNPTEKCTSTLLFSI